MPGRGAEPGLRGERPLDAAVRVGTASCAPGGGSAVPTRPLPLLPVVPVPPLGWWAVSSRPRCLRLASAKAPLTCKLLCWTHLPEVPVATRTPSPSPVGVWAELPQVEEVWVCF